MKMSKSLILDRYIIKELSGSFFFGVMSFTVIMVAGDLLFDIADLIIEKGVSFWVVARLFSYKLPSVITLTLPMACLLSTLLSFGRLSANSELIALKASGVAFQRIIRPVIISAFFIGAVALMFNETVVPMANRAADNIMRYEVAKERPSLLKERIFLREESEGRLNRVIYINMLKPRLGIMSEILIQEFEKGHLRKITTAEKGIWQNGEWTLEQGEVFDVTSDGKVNILYKFKNQKISLELNPGQVARASRDPEDMGLFELSAHINLLKSQGANLLPLRVMYHLRLAIPWATLVLALVGAALGVRPQRTGPGIGFGLSIIIVFAYYVVMSICRALGQAGGLPPFLAAWLPNIIFLFFGAFLARRVNY